MAERLCTVVREEAGIPCLLLDLGDLEGTILLLSEKERNALRERAFARISQKRQFLGKRES